MRTKTRRLKGTLEVIDNRCDERTRHEIAKTLMTAARCGQLRLAFRRQCAVFGEQAAAAALQIITRYYLDELFNGRPAPCGAADVIETTLAEAMAQVRRS
jgi:hypothetical protein